MIILLPARVQENRLSNPPSVDPRAKLKQEAAEFAVQFVESGMLVGLGTGSTAIFATRKIGALLRDGTLKYISGFATSQATQNEAQQLGIPMIDTSLPLKIDVTIIQPHQGRGRSSLPREDRRTGQRSRNHRRRREQVVEVPGNIARSSYRSEPVRLALAVALLGIAGRTRGDSQKL
jgi:hypothetical protein